MPPDVETPNTRINQAVHLDRKRFDALDILAFVIGVFSGGILTALYSPKGTHVVGGGLGFGWLALRVKRAHEKRTHTTTRGIGGAICLALSAVLLPISGLATLIMVVREVAVRDGRGVSWLLVSGIVLTASIFMWRFARKVGNE
jgi:hypothetical protein